MNRIAHVGDFVFAYSRRPRRFAIGIVREIVICGKRWYRIGPENPNKDAFPWIYPAIRHITRMRARRLIQSYHKKAGTPMYHQIWNFLIEEHRRKKKPSSSPSEPSFLKHLNAAIRGQNIDPTDPDGTNEPADLAAPLCSATATAPGDEPAEE